MAHLYPVIAFIAYAIASVCLLAYRKDGARHRHHVSWVAWALLVVLGASAIDLVFSARAHAIGFLEAARAVLLSLFIIGSRGNVARLLRSE